MIRRCQRQSGACLTHGSEVAPLGRGEPHRADVRLYHGHLHAMGSRCLGLRQHAPGWLPARAAEDSRPARAPTTAQQLASRAAMLAASPASANSAGVTSLTFLSVVCALKITATSSWKVDA